MRSLGWFVILALCIPLVAGCNSGGGPTAADSAFEKDLADAAAKNKNPPKSKGKKAASDMPAASGGTPPAGGSPPPNPNRPAVPGG